MLNVSQDCVRVPSLAVPVQCGGVVIYLCDPPWLSIVATSFVENPLDSIFPTPYGKFVKVKMLNDFFSILL